MKTVSNKLLFGTAGVPHSSPRPTTLSGIKRISEISLDCLEIEFVRGMKMGSDLAQKIKKATLEYDVQVSAHAPYYLNFNSEEKGKRMASQERLMSTARTAELCGASNVVFHPGYYQRSTPEQAYTTIKKELTG